MLTRLDFWLTLFTIVAAIYYFGWKDFLEPRVMPIVRWIGGQLPNHETANRTAQFVTIPLPAADEPPGSVREPPYVLALNAEEITAVARMIVHNANVDKPTQSSTIEAGFGYKRGGGPGYDRARDIYQAIFTPPKVTKFPELTPDKKRAEPKTA